jgi:hypothetical protein
LMDMAPNYGVRAPFSGCLGRLNGTMSYRE